MIKEILPPQVAAEESFGELPHGGPDPAGPEPGGPGAAAAGGGLYPAEEAAVAQAVPRRQREFSAARACARTALGRLGLPAGPIPAGQRGAPQWPDGVVGSITHCPGYRAAVVAKAAEIRTVGLDAEPDGPLPARVLAHIASPAEQARVAELIAASPGLCWDRLLFCAKETVYKAWYPLTRRWLGFGDAEITLDPAARTFTAFLLVQGQAPDGTALTSFTGRWLARDGLILAAIAVPAGRPGTD